MDQLTLQKIRAYGTIAMSVFAISTFATITIWAFVTHDDAMKNLLGGLAGGMAGTAVNWWLGSSKGSEKKDDVIAASPAVSNGTAPTP